MVLVTGGVAGPVWRWLACADAEYLVLLGRCGKDASDAPELAAELEASGVRVGARGV
ncbi:KR domain-containing protein [Amycolatopsis sp. NPDC049691]|uniref:KR domain-containing protein n=1 Tax=Amycolatopsis sp. NPDC049691 TaxID=3155155 RepID=UPI00342B5A11